MIRSVLLLGAAALAGCAASVPTAPSASHPAALDAAPLASSALLAPLPPAEAPDVPAVLRPVAASMDHGGMHSASTNHSAEDYGADAHAGHAMPAEATAPSPLADALDAYLVVHDALASDLIDGVPEAATVFRTAFAAAIEVAPAGDPHFWHMRADATAAVLEAARALAEADAIEAARAAFAALSLPLADLTEATPGAPALVRHTCGMRADLPGDGVWLQRPGTVRNPYFGGEMLMCGRPDASGHDGHDHQGHGADSR